MSYLCYLCLFTYCVVFLFCFVFSQDCPFLIAPSVFSITFIELVESCQYLVAVELEEIIYLKHLL